MLLPPALYSRLAGAPGAAEPLPVERSPAAGAPPFRFTPRPVRFPRDHEFFEDGDVQRHLYLQDMLTQVSETPEKSMVPEFTCQVAGCCQVFAALEDYQHHYHMLHGNTCSFCSRAFPSGHLLDVHILEWHDSLFQILAQRQDMYQCLVEGCPQKFKTSQDRKDHMVRLHLYPADFRFDKPKTNRGKKNSVFLESFVLGNQIQVLPTALPSAAQPCQLQQTHQPEPWKMTVTPWISALNLLPHLPAVGPTATEYLLLSVLARVQPEALKALRKETNTSDGSWRGKPDRLSGSGVPGPFSCFWITALSWTLATSLFPCLNT